MPTDLEIIAQLEQRIGKKLKRLEKNQLDSVGYQLNKQQRIVGLGLYKCGLTEFPQEIAQLQNLQELDLSSNQLSQLPAEIAQLQNLQYLYLSSNQLSQLPAEIAQLQNLQTLYLSSNQLSQLPAEIAQLQNLQYLNLSSNQLSQLPAEIAQLQNLRYLALDNNPLKTPPYEIAMEGIDAIRSYFNSLGDNPQSVNEIKVVLVGEGASGKTSLVKRLFNEPFEPHEKQTHGILIRHWQLNATRGQSVKARLWDFGGQQIMHATHQFFLSKRSLYLLVIDGRKEEKTEYWLQHIESLGGNSPTLVILNKIDENPGFEVNRKFLKEKYPFIFDFYRISCCKNAGIEDVKEALQQAIDQVEILQTLWPQNWLAVKQALEQENQAGVDYINYDSYLELCQQHHIEQENYQHILIKFLHDLGVVIHFRQAVLEETNVINPEWVTEAVYKIVTSEILAKKKGIITIDDVGQLLDTKRYPSHKRNYIVELMKKFELCYELDNKQILVPDLLPVEEPDFTFDETEAIHFVLEYEFLPKVIMAKFIVKMHRDIQNGLCWRTGVVLTDKQFAANAVVKADDEARKIDITVNGQQRREYFAAILYIFRDIHKLFHESFSEKVKEYICLPDGDRVSYQHLIGLERRGKKEYSTENNDYIVSELLGTVRSEDSMQAILVIVSKLAEQMLSKDEFLTKMDDVLKRIAEESKSEDDLINRIAILKPNIAGIGIDINELIKIARRWWRN